VVAEFVRELLGRPVGVGAGEDVRLIPVRGDAWPADVPRHDYWLFDDDRLWLTDYSPAGAFEAARLVDEQIAIDEHRRWRDAAIAASIRLADYEAAHQPV
jgi:hypothetical protein